MAEAFSDWSTAPEDQPELEELFVTRQTLNAENTCQGFWFKVSLHCDGKEDPCRLNWMNCYSSHMIISAVLEIEFSGNYNAKFTRN